MPEPSLPDRLRDLAQRTSSPEHPTGTRETVDLLLDAAAELEACARRDALAARAVREAEAQIARLHHVEPRPLSMFAAESARLEREAYPPLHVIGAELAGDGGIAAPMPQPRVFVAYYRDGWTLPAPGSFVQAGAVGSTWRVLAAAPVELAAGEVLSPLTDADGGTRRAVQLELEAVDPHDVPMTARVDIVPLPLDAAEATS